MGLAAAEGSLDMLAWGLSNHCPCNALTAAAAAGAGQLAALQWLRERRCPIDASVLLAAARSGDARVFQWAAIALADERMTWPQPGELLVAAASAPLVFLMCWLPKYSVHWHEPHERSVWYWYVSIFLHSILYTIIIPESLALSESNAHRRRGDDPEPAAVWDRDRWEYSRWCRLRFGGP